VFLTKGAEPQLRRQVIDKFSNFVGLDVQEATIAVAVADSSSSEARFVGEIVNTPEAINKLVKQLKVGDVSFSLARLHRAGELTAVWVPNNVQEALRDLTRAREDFA
jgi:transposase